MVLTSMGFASPQHFPAGWLTFLNLTVLIYKRGIILCYKGIIPCCISNAPHSISLVTFNLYIYYKYMCPTGNPPFSQGSLARYIPPEVRTNDPRYGEGTVFSLCPSAPPWVSGTSLFLLGLPSPSS